MHPKLASDNMRCFRDAVNAEELSLICSASAHRSDRRRTQRAIRLPAMVLAATQHRVNRGHHPPADRDWLEAYFQPRVDAMTGRVTGFEALARWRHWSQRT